MNIRGQALRQKTTKMPLKGDESFVALATRPPSPPRFLQTFGFGRPAEFYPVLNKYYIPIPGLNSARSWITIALRGKAFTRTPQGLHENSAGHTYTQNKSGSRNAPGFGTEIGKKRGRASKRNRERW